MTIKKSCWRSKGISHRHPQRNDSQAFTWWTPSSASGSCPPAAPACFRAQGSEEFTTFTGHLPAEVGGPTDAADASLAGYALKKFYMILALQSLALLDETSTSWGTTTSRQGSQPPALPHTDAVVPTSDSRMAHEIRPVSDSSRRRARTGGLRVIEPGRRPTTSTCSSTITSTPRLYTPRPPCASLTAAPSSSGSPRWSVRAPGALSVAMGWDGNGSVDRRLARAAWLAYCAFQDQRMPPATLGT